MVLDDKRIRWQWWYQTTNISDDWQYWMRMSMSEDVGWWWWWMTMLDVEWRCWMSDDGWRMSNDRRWMTMLDVRWQCQMTISNEVVRDRMKMLEIGWRCRRSDDAVGDRMMLTMMTEIGWCCRRSYDDSRDQMTMSDNNVWWQYPMTMSDVRWRCWMSDDEVGRRRSLSRRWRNKANSHKSRALSTINGTFWTFWTFRTFWTFWTA